jgi:MSHA pilin protein MshD
MSRYTRGQGGVTLIEMLITIVVLSIALVAMTSVVDGSVSRSADPLIQHRSVLLAQAYADEILSKRFAETTPVGGVPAATDASVCITGSEAGETRTDYDDVDDYDTLTDSPPELQTATDFTQYADFSVSVAVACTGIAMGFSNDYDVKAITITINSPDGRTLAFTSYRGNY